MNSSPASSGTQRASSVARWAALLAGVLALLLCLFLGQLGPRQALLSYLFAFIFFTGLSVGGLAVAMVHVLTGGEWGYFLRPYLVAAQSVLPLQAALAIPLLIGVSVIYPWAAPERLAHDAVLQAQSWYLNPTFFSVRTFIYFAIWWLFATKFQRSLDRPERLARIAATGLIVYAVTGTLAAVDWAMSLLPHWHSTIFGMMVITGWMLSSGALATLCVAWPHRARHTPPPQLLHDLGNLLLAMVLGWSYLAFMQYLTVWIADLPAETSWYIPRTLTSWREWAWLLITFHFAIPFAVLLSRRAKRHLTWLAGVAALLLIAHLADALWLIVPNSRPEEIAFTSTDFFAPIGIGGLWLFVFLSRLVGAARDAHTADLAIPRVENVRG